MLIDAYSDCLFIVAATSKQHYFAYLYNYHKHACMYLRLLLVMSNSLEMPSCCMTQMQDTLWGPQCYEINLQNVELLWLYMLDMQFVWSIMHVYTCYLFQPWVATNPPSLGDDCSTFLNVLLRNGQGVAWTQTVDSRKDVTSAASEVSDNEECYTGFHCPHNQILNNSYYSNEYPLQPKVCLFIT